VITHFILGDYRAFSLVGPSRKVDLTTATRNFRRELKTFMFRRSYDTVDHKVDSQSAFSFIASISGF